MLTRTIIMTMIITMAMITITTITVKAITSISSMLRARGGCQSPNRQR